MAKKKERKPNKEYTLEPCSRKHDYRILTCDPGTKNFGIACVGVKNGKVDVIANAVLTNPMYELTADVMRQRDLFSKEVRQWFKLYDPNLVIAERFQTRGNGGPTIETVSLMLGLLGAFRRIPYKYVIAGQWKNAFNKRWAEGDKEFLKGLYGDCLTTPHQLDATLIGVYGLEYALQTQLSYTPSKIIEMVETTSRLELRRPRK
jgi:hypothetical protein